jgi:S1-C subfamily serine protease
MALRLAKTSLFFLVAILPQLAWAEANQLHLTGNMRWVVLASRQNVDEAIGIAQYYGREGIRVVRAKNGWYAVIKGPKLVTDTNATKNELNKSGLFPPLPVDFYFSRGESYVETVWQPRQSRYLASTSLKARRNTSLVYGNLAIEISIVAYLKGRIYAVGRQQGKVIFEIDLDGADITEYYPLNVGIVRLDRETSQPQIVLDYFTGGAHCCTVTKIVTLDRSGIWRVVSGGTLDGGGYRIADLTGDGVSDLVSVDNAFLYAFDCYVCSAAPIKISRLVGQQIENVTNQPRYQSYLRQDLHRMEYSAKMNQDMLRSNGFLAGWVAAKSLLGEAADAWSTMLKSYNRNPDFGPQECAVAVAIDRCPSDKLRRIEFPIALNAHLQKLGYLPSNFLPSMPTPSPSKPPSEPGGEASGTGFFVSGDGQILTNDHVVSGCARIVVTPNASNVSAHIVSRDSANDLALLKVSYRPASFARLRTNVRLGEGIAVFGFPLVGFLATSGNFTLGNVTALAGIADDSRILQISAPIQPGNSGGPLLDHSGNVVGVVTAKLNALRVAAATNDLAQNVNFAIKASVAVSFLASNGISSSDGTLTSILQPADIAERAKSFTVLITCQK